MATKAFITIIERSLDHWQQLTSDLEDETAAPRLDQERHNLYQAVEMGLALQQTWPEAAAVALQAFPLAERRGYWQEWRTVLQRALAHADPDETHLQCQLLNKLGQLYRLSRQLPEAVAAHEQALELAEKLGSSRLRVETHYNLAEAHLRNRAYDEAEAHGDMALRLLDELEGADRTYWTAVTLNTLGELARLQGRPDLAEARLARAVEMRRRLQQPLPLARTLNDFALALIANGKIEAALARLQEAEELVRPTDFQHDKAMIALNVALAHFQCERWQAAETALRRIDADYLRQSGHVYYQAVTAQSFGIVLARQARYSEAKPHLTEAISLWREAHDDVEQANSLLTLGEVLAAEGRPSEAIPRYREAIDLLAQHPDDGRARRQLAQARQELAELLENQGSNHA